jgi:hypothetical protein
MEIEDIINSICYDETLSRQDRVELAKRVSSAKDLSRLLDAYNWDDGYEIPIVIAMHVEADLGVALKLFWLANAEAVYLGDFEESQRNRDWVAFCRMLSSRILDGNFANGASEFAPPLTKVQTYQFRKAGLPEIFLQSLPGTE